MRARSPWPAATGRRPPVRGLALAVAALLAGGVAGVATGAGGGDDAEGGGAGAAPPGVHSAAAPASGGDGARAGRSVLRHGDLPPGWRPWDEGGAGGRGGGELAFGACPAVASATTGQLGGEASSAFRHEGAPFAFVTSWGAVAKSEDVARAAFALLGSEGFDCAQRVFLEGAAQRKRPDAAGLAPQPRQPLALPPVGGELAAARFTFAVHGPAVDVPAFLDVVAVRVERAVALAAFASAGHPFDPALQHTLLANLAARMAP